MDVVRPQHIGLDHDSWGIDHGTWSVLAHLFPAADIPVVQLSIHGAAPLNLGSRLAPLRSRGIFIVGSGNVVHNLRQVNWSYGERGFDWSERFDLHVQAMMTLGMQPPEPFAGGDDAQSLPTRVPPEQTNA